MQGVAKKDGRMWNKGERKGVAGRDWPHILVGCRNDCNRLRFLGLSVCLGCLPAVSRSRVPPELRNARF